MHERVKAFFATAITEARPPTAQGLALELGKMGFDIGEAAVRTWRNGKHQPDLEVVLAIAARYRISLDEYAFGDALEVKLRGQLHDQAEQQRGHAAKLQELESIALVLLNWANRAGEKVGEHLAADIPDESAIQYYERIIRASRTGQRADASGAG